MTDYWAHYYFDNPKAAEEVEDEDFSLEAEIARIEAEAENLASRNDPSEWEDVKV